MLQDQGTAQQLRKVKASFGLGPLLEQIDFRGLWPDER